jgi:colicin import membrane protein
MRRWLARIFCEVGPSCEGNPRKSRVPREISGLVVLMAASVLGTAWAAEGIDVAAQRQRIERERKQAEDAYRAEDAKCQTRFSVSSCVEEARARRRTTLERLNNEQAVLDQMERRRRAAERTREIEEKVNAAKNRPPPEVTVTPRTPKPPRPTASAASGPDYAAPKPRPGPDAAEQAAAAAAYDKRQREAAAHRTAVEQRNAERARSGKHAAPLPPPPAASK